MGSLDSSIRSAARATSSAYKRLPIRWRLAGGSAALTLVILCGFAVIVGVLTTRQIHEDFRREVETSADRIVTPGAAPAPARQRRQPASCGPRRARSTSATSPPPPAPRSASSPRTTSSATPRPTRPTSGRRWRAPTEIDGWRVETREVPVAGWPSPWALQYAKPISEVQDTANRVKVFLAFGVLGGALLALLAGLAVARRAMEPITELTAAARRIEQYARPDREDPAHRGRGRGGRAGAARWRRCSPRSARRAPRPRARWRASASSWPTPRTSCARR